MIASYLAVEFITGVFHQPYLWDELGVYSRAAIYMYENHLSLLPDSIPDELSRGHPLFCPFYFALAFKLFGCMPLVAHTAAAIMNICTFLFVYHILKRYMNHWIAALSAFALFIQPAFLSQSVLILPEMPLMFATTGVILTFLNRQFFACSIFSVLALQIKESALIIPIALLLADLIANRKFIFKNFIYLFLIPVLSFLTFIIIQKYQRGYFFYPLHTELSSFDSYYIKERWTEFRNYIAFEQGHFLILITALISLPYRKIRTLDIQYPEMIFPIIILGGIGFLSLNFYISRYALYFILPIYVGVFSAFTIRFKNNILLQIGLALILIFSGIFHFNNGKKYTDVDFSYVSHVKNIQQALSFLDQAEFRGSSIKVGFPLAAAYWGDKNGYVRNADYKLVLSKEEISQFQVFTFPGDMHDTLSLPKNSVLVKELHSDYAFSRIYRLPNSEKP